MVVVHKFQNLFLTFITKGLSLQFWIKTNVSSDKELQKPWYMTLNRPFKISIKKGRTDTF